MLIYQPTNSLSNHNYNAVIYENANWYMHFHKNLELVYVIEGEVKAFLNENEYNLVKNDFFLVLPNQIHGYASVGNSKIWIGVFSEDYVREFNQITKNKIGDNPIFNCSDEELLFLKSCLLKTEPPDLIMLLKYRPNFPPFLEVGKLGVGKMFFLHFHFFQRLYI